MIRAAIISPDQELSSQLCESLAEFPSRIGVARTLHQYPNEARLAPFLSAAAPQLVFLSAEHVSDALDVLERIQTLAPEIAVVAINRTPDGTTMLKILRAGVKDFLALPFESSVLAEMLRRVEAYIESTPGAVRPLAPIFGFLPAKAGAGSTTLAVNASLALARRPGAKVLLIDLDLNSGMVGFQLSVKPEYSVIDAAENAADMDETMWTKLVTSVGPLDVLPAGSSKPDFRIHTVQVRRILEFAQRSYDAICVDLSGMMEKYSVEILDQMQQVFLICTPEVTTLHLAVSKLDLLRTLELDNRVSVILNRLEKRHGDSEVAAFESILAAKILLTAPNSYAETQKALVEGKPVRPTSALGVTIEKLAQAMIPAAPATAAPAAPARQRGFLGSLVARKETPVKDIPLIGSRQEV